MKDPLSLLASWQVCVLALVTLLLTQATKTLLDYFLASREGGLRAAVRTGADLRRQHPVVTQLLVPLLPVLFGVLIALTLPPIRPTALEHWVQYSKEPSWLAHLVWGIYCGILADYTFSHVHDARRAARQRAG
jgi:hypothetical protein